MTFTLPNPGTPTFQSKTESANERSLRAALVAKFIKGINDTDITDGSLIERLMNNAVSAQAYFAAYTVAQPYGFTQSGGLGLNAGSLTHTVPATVAFPKQTSSSPTKLVRVSIASESHTYTANRDTYVYATSAGAFRYDEYANGAPTPSIPTDSTPLMKVVSGAATLTVTDTRILLNAGGANGSTPKNYRTGMYPVYKTATTVASSAGAIDYGGQQLLQTGESSTVDVTNNANFVSGTAAINQWQWLVGADNGAGGVSLKFTTGGPTASDYAGTAGSAGYDAFWRTYAGTVYRYLGAIRTDGAGNILKFFRLNDIVYWVDFQNVLAGGAAAAFAALSLATRVSPTSRFAALDIYSATGAGPANNKFRATGSGDTGRRFQSSANNFGIGDFWVNTDANQSVDYVVGTPGTIDVDVAGFKEAL